LGKIFEKDEMGGTCSTYGREERRIQDFGGKPDGKRPLGRPRLRLQDNIKMERQIEWEGLDQIFLAQVGKNVRAVTNTLVDLRVP
jgi:hypothetical protein